MKKYKWNIGCNVIALLLASTAQANIDHSGFKVSAYGGWQASILNPGPYTLIGNEVEVLDPTHRKTTAANWGLGVAYRILTPKHKYIFRYTHDVSVGFDLFYFQTYQPGNVIDYGESADFTYRLKLKSLRLMTNVEWTFLPIIHHKVYPFIEGGLGLASNANYYSDTPNPNTSTGMGVTFSKYSTTQLAYDVGAGLKWMPSKNTELSFRYLFSNLGMVRSGTQANLPIDAPYSFALKTQSVLIGLSYLFK